MWLIFKLQRQKFVIEFSGEETFADITHIFREVYGFGQKISFSLDLTRPILENNVPLKDFPGIAGNDHIEIILSVSDTSSFDFQKLRSPNKLNKVISIGSTAPVRVSSGKTPSRTSSTNTVPPAPQAVTAAQARKMPTVDPNDPNNFPEMIQQITDMGFDQQTAEKILRECKYDLPAAVNRILAMPKAAGKKNIEEADKAAAKAEFKKFSRHEKEAIKRLKSTGMDEPTIIATYIQCNKDEAQTRTILSK